MHKCLLKQFWIVCIAEWKNIKKWIYIFSKDHTNTDSMWQFQNVLTCMLYMYMYLIHVNTSRKDEHSSVLIRWCTWKFNEQQFIPNSNWISNLKKIPVLVSEIKSLQKSKINLGRSATCWVIYSKNKEY